MLLCVSGLSVNATAQDLVNTPAQTQEYAPQQNIATGEDMAPPPLGPYQVDPDSKSANIYNNMHETMPYKQHPEQYGGDLGSRYPAGQMSVPYGQGYYPSSAPHGQGYYPSSPMPAPDGYSPQYGETYGNRYPPPYPGYPHLSQPQYGYPYGPQQ